MEANSHRTDNQGTPQPEADYSAHQANPAPSPEAIREPDDRPASQTIWVVVLVAIIAMALIYLVFFY